MLLGLVIFFKKVSINQVKEVILQVEKCWGLRGGNSLPTLF